MGGRRFLTWFIISLAAFHAAWLVPALSPGAGVFAFGLLQLTGVTSARRAFYAAFGLGLLCYAPHLFFFWGIFGPPAAFLWAVVAVWPAVFAALLQRVRVCHGLGWAAGCAPVAWLGLEYFRSELYYLKFSWLGLGYFVPGEAALHSVLRCGVYGFGFLVIAWAAWAWWLSGRRGLVAGWAGLLLWSVGQHIPLSSGPAPDSGTPRALSVAGVQLEFPGPVEVRMALDRLVKAHPEAQLLVLSEYTFDGPIPATVMAWCRTHQRYLLAGGKDPLPEGGYRNTAFVIGPDGTVVFRQAKTVPIQFFNDGLPAAHQEVWPSPWGKLGILICYDLSYARVADALVRAGAEALLVPTMDIMDWGQYQHALHGRIAPMRAAEYGVPVYRLASSGISQAVAANGRQLATTPCPGQGEILAASLRLAGPGHLPWDRHLAPCAVALTLVVFMLGCRRTQPSNPD